jgi:lipopolysaccharide export system permease protein
MILYQYLIGTYLRTFFLAVATFVSVLLVSRFKDLARFAALTSDQVQTALYAVYQIPFILPMAIPLSAFIASYLLFSHLSRTSEFTALRAASLSLQKILMPLFLCSLLLALLNFAILAEVAPFCRQASRDLLLKEKTINPLLLLQRQPLLHRHPGYLRMEVDGDGGSAHNFRFITYNDSNDRLTLITAGKWTFEGKDLFGQDVSIISHIPGEKFDPLIIENQKTLSTPTGLFLSKLQKNRHKIDNSGFSLKMLRVRAGSFAEILRRISLSLSAVSLTLLGCLFGIAQGRTPSRRPLLFACFLTLLLLDSFFLGKMVRHNPLLAALSYFLPHLLIWAACLYRGRSIARGIA